MVSFLRSLSNIIIISVTILTLIALFFKAIEPLKLLIVLAILLFLGFISLVVYWFSKLESKINLVEQKFKRADKLIDIKRDIKALKLIFIKNGQKKKNNFK